MRYIFILGLPAVWGCTGTDPEPRPDPEICDDGIDNDGNGAIDCDDSACGGLPCMNQGDDDDDTTEPPGVVEIVYNEQDCCDFTFGQSDCPQMRIGTITIINRSTEYDGQVDVFCDRVGPDAAPVIQWVAGNAPEPRPTVVNAPVPRESEIEIDGVFVCQTGVNQDFTSECTAFIEAGPEGQTEEDEVTFVISATALNP